MYTAFFLATQIGNSESQHQAPVKNPDQWVPHANFVTHHNALGYIQQ